MVVLIFIAVFLATYTITYLVWWLIANQIIKLPNNVQISVFVIITTILFTPIFSAFVIVVLPVPSLFFLLSIPVIGDLQETYRIASMTGPLNIITPILTALVSFKLAPKILSNKALKRDAEKASRPLA